MTKEELKTVMEKNGLNVKRLAAMLRVSGRTVYQWLDGTRRMPEMADELLGLKVSKHD